jgi:putative heme-binding domain-containing protein
MFQAGELPQTRLLIQTRRRTICYRNAERFCGILLILLWLAGLAGSAQTSNSVQGAQRFAEYCSGCHGADGKGGAKAASLAMTLSVMTRSDAELEGIVRDGTSEGMPSFAQIGDDNISAIVQYLRTSGEGSSASAVAVSGDVPVGRDLYFGKARCASCHRIDGDGGFIASDLTAWSRTHTPDAIRQAITSPDNPVPRGSRVATVTTQQGKKLSGVLRYEDNFSVALQTLDGRYHLLSKKNLTGVEYSGHSLMPRDYAEQLTSRELNDIVSFLVVTGRSTSVDTAPPH